MKQDSEPQPLVSIVIPTRNRINLLKYAVASCINQTYKNIQIIVHDNNSKDGTFEYIVKNFNDPRLEIYRSDKDLIMQENWNKAANYAKGEYFVRLDDDNIFLLDFIETAVKNMNIYKLNCFVALPMTIYQGQKKTIFFQPKNKTMLLNKYQILYLNYFCITDTNYVVYETKLLRKLFKQKIYTTSLPDRHIDYVLSSKMEKLKLRYGITSLIKAISRVDYRTNSFKGYGNVVYQDYAALNKKFDIKKIDCHDNFALHRMINIMETLDRKEDEKLLTYFDKNLTKLSEIKLVARMGKLFEAGYLPSWSSFVNYHKYLFQIMGRLILLPGKKIEGKSSYMQLIRVLGLTLNVYKNTVIRKMSAEKVDPSYGNKLCEKVIAGKKIEDTFKGMHGSFANDLELFLDKIDRKTKGL